MKSKESQIMLTDDQFAGDTNSQFYMWETSNPSDTLAFEQDFIASTNEEVYSSSNAIAYQKQLLYDRPLAHKLYKDEMDNSMLNKSLELDLEMDDILNEF